MNYKREEESRDGEGNRKKTGKEEQHLGAYPAELKYVPSLREIQPENLTVGGGDGERGREKEEERKGVEREGERERLRCVNSWSARKPIELFACLV